MEPQYLAFVDYLGETIDGKYSYRFDYTENTDVVWGDYFNVVPCVIIPNLQPDKNCLSYSEEVTSERNLLVAKRNECFSMQDCIDGIISMCFTNLNEDNIESFHFDFGEDIETVHEKFDKYGIVSKGLTQIVKGSDEMIDKLIEDLDDGEFDE